MTRVLAAIVVPPHLSMSGGARAAEQLSAALSSDCDMTVASMMTADVTGLGAARNAVRRARVSSSLPAPLSLSRLPNRYRTLFYRSNIPQIVDSGRYDLVHIHNPMPAIEMERVARACLRAGIPYVVSTHGFNEVWNGNQIYDFNLAKKLVWRSLVQGPVARVVRRASGIFALSSADFPIIREMGYTGDELTVVPNGVDAPQPFDPARDAAILARRAIPAEKSRGQITCMFLANHTPNKGLPILLEAFAKLQRPYLLIIGGEKRGDVDYERYINSCRAGQRIIVTGRLDDDEVGSLYRRSDLFVFPTLADTFPLVVLEAMAHGTPVLASRVGGIPHQFNDTCGRLVTPGDAAGLCAAIDDLADTPERLQAMGRAARDHVENHFSWSRAATHALAGYDRVLREKRCASLSQAQMTAQTI